jgi:hypothetical protein
MMHDNNDVFICYVANMTRLIYLRLNRRLTNRNLKHIVVKNRSLKSLSYSDGRKHKIHTTMSYIVYQSTFYEQFYYHFLSTIDYKIIRMAYNYIYCKL